MVAGAMSRTRVDRGRLVTVASDLANRNGLDRLSMNEIALALGVRTPSLYSHVEGLDDVKRLIALAGLESFDKFLTREALGKSAAEAVKAIAHGVRKFARANPGVYAALLPTPDRDDREWNKAKDRVTDTFLRVLKGYGFDHEAEIHAMRGLRSLVHGFASLELSGALKNPVDREDSFDWLVLVFTEGLEAEAKSGRAGRKKK
jgi:AcrR family transcriptional regulator